MILDEPEGARIHAEARRRSFTLYDDFGKGFSVELDWEDLDDMHRAVCSLKAYALLKGITTSRTSPTQAEEPRK
jgi:hypothetical protein